jgi:hypothetical protein
MMSHEDERRLAAIERQMLDDDPDFVRRFRQSVARSMRAQRVRGAMRGAVLCTLWAMVGLGWSLAVIGVLAGWFDVLLPGCLLAAAAWWRVRVLRRRWQRPE